MNQNPNPPKMTTNNPETHNPPAFPIADRDQASFGMTLRDYFAAKAMQSLLRNIAGNHVDGCDEYAALAYEWADAMLAARQKGSQP